MAVRPSFFAELKRRNVLRAGVLYIGAAWALAQGVSQLTPAIGLPDAATRWFLIVAIIGFPFWVAFAWFYEFTPQGIKRESEVTQNAAFTHSTARKLDFAIIGVLAVAVILLASGYFIRRSTPLAVAAATAVTPKPFNPPADTLAVLPFTNLNGDPKQQYFSDGITEELTNALGQNAALTVIAWDTASKYRNSNESPREIGRALNVANLLHGSIQRENGTVRVITELVDARTGRQLWADHYDDSAANVFAMQDKITAAISDALNVKFAAMKPTRTVDPRAHDLVLKARNLLKGALQATSFEEARDLYRQAIVLDPDYADAHAGLADTWFLLGVDSPLPLKEALINAREEADKALALDPRNVAAMMTLGEVDQQEGRLEDARRELSRAVALDPSNALAHGAYANTLPFEPMLEQTREAARLDPANVRVLFNLVWYLLDASEYRQALAPAQAAVKLAPRSANGAFLLAYVEAQLGRHNDAVAAFDAVTPDSPLDKALVAAGRLTYQSVVDPRLRAQALKAVDALRARPDLGSISQYDLIQLYLVLGEKDAALGMLPGTCAASPVLCNDISLWPFARALHGNAAFEALVKKYDTMSPSSARSS